jgi:hypothetical protein
VEDLVQVVSSQEKELAEKNALVADLQQQLENSGSFLLSWTSLSTFMLSDQYCAYISAMQMLPSLSPHLRLWKRATLL